jgi:two-component system LytT family response regulator
MTMNNNLSKIRIAIIDDNQDCITSLLEKLSFFSEIEVCGYETRYKQSLGLLLYEKPDLVFLDIEMPCKSGFKLLNEARERGANFSVIFFTSYSKYMVQALRESALDYILKPVDPAELKNAINRYKVFNSTQLANQLSGMQGRSETIIIPSQSGLQFLEKNNILLFQSNSETIFHKTYWEALQTDLKPVKLGHFLSAKKIMNVLPCSSFFQINQSCIINLSFLYMVQHSTRNCLLIPPYDKIKLTVSRSQLTKMKEDFEVF